MENNIEVWHKPIQKNLKLEKKITPSNLIEIIDNLKFNDNPEYILNVIQELSTFENISYLLENTSNHEYFLNILKYLSYNDVFNKKYVFDILSQIKAILVNSKYEYYVDLIELYELIIIVRR